MIMFTIKPSRNQCNSQFFFYQQDQLSQWLFLLLLRFVAAVAAALVFMLLLLLLRPLLSLLLLLLLLIIRLLAGPVNRSGVEQTRYMDGCSSVYMLQESSSSKQHVGRQAGRQDYKSNTTKTSLQMTCLSPFGFVTGSFRFGSVRNGSL